MATLLGSVPCLVDAQTPARSDSVIADSTLFNLDPVIVTATRRDLTADQIAVSINLVGRAELRQQPSRLLLDALVAEPGLLVQQTTAGQGAAFIRALTGSQVLLMVDGVRLNNGTFRQGPSQYLSSVDPEIMERMEVVRGASSALYGSDAMGGVINVITRRGANLLEVEETAAIEGSYTYDGATNGSRARASGAAALPDLMSGLEAFGGVSFATYSDLVPGGGLPAQDPTGYDQWGADLRLDLQATPALRFELAGQHAEQSDVPRYDRYVDFRSPELPGGGVGRSALYLFEPQDRSLLRLRSHVVSDRAWMSSLDVQLSWQNQREGRAIRSQSTIEGVLTPSERVRHVSDGVRSLALDVQAQTIIADGRGALTYGIEAWDNTTDSKGWTEDVATGALTPTMRASGAELVPTGRFPDASSFRGAAAYAFADQPWGRLRVQLGGRGSLYWVKTRVGDDFGGDVDTRVGNVTGELGIVFDASDVVSLRARAAQAFRAPNIYDLTLVGDVPGGFALPGPDLQPETSYTLEAGIHVTRPTFSGDLTVFRLKINDLMDRVFGSFVGDTLFGPDQLRVLTIQNVGEATLHGAEAAVSAALPAGVRADVSTFWTVGDAMVARDGVLVEEPFSRVPPLTAAFRVRWPLTVAEQPAWFEYFGKASNAQTRLGFRDEIDRRIQAGGTPGYDVHSVRAGTALGQRLQVAIGLENIFDELFRVHGSGIDAPGRHLFFRLDLRR